jgi:hypothetical protein
VDFDGGILRAIRASAMPGAFGRVEAPMRQVVEALRNASVALTRFLKSDLQYFAGMRNLFEAFYSAIRTGDSPPIPYDDIQRIANIMDQIFAGANCGSLLRQPAEPITSESRSVLQ